MPPDNKGKYVGNTGGPHYVRKVSREYPKPLSHIFVLGALRSGTAVTTTLPPHDNGKQVGDADGPNNKRQR